MEKPVTLKRKIIQEKRGLVVPLEDALDIAGCGRFQNQHCCLMLATLSAALLEMIGNAFILPAAACDLKLPDQLRGIITSIPNIGIIVTAPLWGWAADRLGRRPVLLLSTAAAGVVGMLAAAMPSLLSFALCKLAASLFLSGPSSLGFAFAGEMVPKRKRDKTLLVLNGCLMISTTLSPVLAWAILSTKIKYYIGIYPITSWRILTAVYAFPLILASIWMIWAVESPKFLMAKDRPEEAMKILRHIFSVNWEMKPEKYPVASLKPASECLDASCASTPLLGGPRADSLLRAPHCRWLALIGFLMFGLFSSLNGLFLFAPEVINKAMTDTSNVKGTICMLLHNPEADIEKDACDDTVSHRTFAIMVLTTLVYGLAVAAASLSAIRKRTQLLAMFATVATTCWLSVLTTNRLLAGVLMSSLQLTALGVGVLAAYAVHLFPTTLRGTAVGAVLMCGRLGSVAGANAAGYLLIAACTPTFYGFSALLFVCAGLVLLLPKDEKIISTIDEED